MAVFPILQQAPTTINAGGVPIETNQIASITVNPDGGMTFSLRKPSDAIAGFGMGSDAHARATEQLTALGSFLGGMEQQGLANAATASHLDELGKKKEADEAQALAGALLQAAAAQENKALEADLGMANGMLEQKKPQAHAPHGPHAQHAPHQHAAHAPQHHATHMAHSPSGPNSWMNKVEARREADQPGITGASI